LAISSRLKIARGPEGVALGVPAMERLILWASKTSRRMHIVLVGHTLILFSLLLLMLRSTN
jgi:hypothetical protein